MDKYAQQAKEKLAFDAHRSVPGGPPPGRGIAPPETPPPATPPQRRRERESPRRRHRHRPPPQRRRKPGRNRRPRRPARLWLPNESGSPHRWRRLPGLNAVIRALVRQGRQEYGYEFIGFRDGWRGPLEGDTVPLDVQAVRGILPRGGTILGTSRTNPFAESAAAGGRSGLERIKDNLAGLGVDALVAIGGEDTLGVAATLHAEGLPVVGVPKTIDNDLSATDYTFGFDTAVNIAMEAIDRLHTTAESHHRALICEVMGRHAGWIALHAGMAGGANVILIPERPFSLEKVCAYVEHRFQTRYAPLVVVAEGAYAEDEDFSPARGGRRRFRARAARRCRPDAGGRDREADRQGGPLRGARAHPARRHPNRVQPGPGHPVRGARDRGGARRFVRHDGGASGPPTSSGSRSAEATSELKTVPLARYAEAEVFFG